MGEASTRFDCVQYLPGALTTVEIDATMGYASAEKALATREAYASDWRVTSPPGALPGTPQPLLAHQGIVAAYLSSLADSGRKASTIGRRAAAIGYHHKMAGHEPPTGSEAVKAVLRGIRRTIGSAKQGKDPKPALPTAAANGAFPPRTTLSSGSSA